MSIEETQLQIRENLTRLRQDRGWTLDKTEGVTGVSAKTFSHYEDGSYLPTISSLFKLCKGLGVSSNEILGF